MSHTEDLRDWSRLLYKLQPSQIVPYLFDYFAIVFMNEPEEKLKEFPIHFMTGIQDVLEYHRLNMERNKESITAAPPH